MNVSDLRRKSHCPGGGTEEHCGRSEEGQVASSRGKVRKESVKGNLN